MAGWPDHYKIASYGSKLYIWEAYLHEVLLSPLFHTGHDTPVTLQQQLLKHRCLPSGVGRVGKHSSLWGPQGLNRVDLHQWQKSNSYGEIIKFGPRFLQLCLP